MAWGPADKGKRRPVRIGKYEVLAHVATGGMGAIYRALDTESGRQVALKVLSPDMAAKPVVVQRFQLEARNAAKLCHENIVAHYDYGEVNGTYYLAQEFVEGVDLHDYVSQRGRLGPDEACQIIIQAARALDHAYQKGIVHRDIKPSNLLIAQQGGRPVVKLTDMGLARKIEDEDFRLTRAGTTVGTLDYMAPEQARDSRAADSRSDIYSLGCTFYFALSGHPPFPKGTIAEKLTAHAEAEPPDIRLENPAVGPGLAALLERMLAKRPEDRFQTPAELLAALADPEAWAHEFFKEPGLVPLDEEAPAIPQITVPAGPERPVLEKKPARPALLKSPFGATGASRTQPRPGVRNRRQRPRRSSRRRRWWPWIVAPAGAGAALAIVLLMWSGDRFSGRDNASRSGGRQSPEAAQRVDALRSGGVSLPLRGLTPSATGRQFAERQPSKAGGPTPRLFQPVYPTPFGPTAAEVRKEFEGPLATLPADMGDVPILRVSRLPGGEPNAFSSLVAAAAKVPPGGKAIIEIHDNGPFFEPALPDLVGCRLLIRAGKGYRPLLAWDTGAAAAATNKSNPPARLLALEKGSLVLEDLDVVVKWTDPSVNRPVALFCIKDGDLIARRCTFSVAGNHSHGIAVAWLEGTSVCRARLSHCYARGGNLVLLHLQSPGGDVLIDDCLAAGGVRPLCAVRGVEEAPATLRWVRSTLVCGRTLLHVRPAEETQQRLALKVFCADSLLAQADPAAEGALVELAKGTAADRVRWKAINSVYVGWKLLLASAGRNIPATALETDWWAFQGYSEGDRALLAPWPTVYPAEPEDAAPAVFNPSGSPAHFAALTGPGPLGCNLAALPAGRPQWLALTWDRPALLLPTLPLGEAPPVPDSADGLYHGEALKLSKAFDLGRYLQGRLASVRPAPRIVLQLEGSGEVPTSPIHLKGCSLVLAVGVARPGKEPLTLVPAPGSADQEALIQVDGGDLEIVGAHLIFPEKRARAAPRHLVKVRGGKLRLFGCHLCGLLSGGGSYQGLIDLAGPDLACVISDSVLASSGSVLSLHGSGQLRLHQSLALAADDLLVLDLADAASRSTVLCALEHATLAGRRNLIDVQGASGPITVRAEGNVFLAPFEASGPSTLLRCNRASVTQGRLLWQGANNGFDRRFHSYLTVAGEPPAGLQPFAAWLRLWGTPGERDPLLLELPKAPFRLSPLRLRQLALPRTARLRPGEAPPGADFARLGLTVGRK